MNRELRRAQAKQDKKVEREKEERKAARRRRVEMLRSRRAARRAEAKASAGTKAAGKSGGEGADKPTQKGGSGAGPGRGRNPGRFAGALAMATVFFIVLQGSVAPEPGENDLLRSVTGAGFYLLFGYFAILWLMRRETPRPLVVTLLFGAFLTAGVEVAKLFQPEVPTDLLLLALALPGLVGGAFLGRLVYTSAPR